MVVEYLTRIEYWCTNYETEKKNSPRTLTADAPIKPKRAEREYLTDEKKLHRMDM